jgi:Zn-dependent membrane protease YugP
MGYLIITVIFTLIGTFIQNKLRSKFEEYSQVGLRNGKSGKEVAEDMLKYYGIHDVQVVSVEGHLTDHYNPQNKTVNLSSNVYASNSIAAAAVAAHECGHAVQHATAYPMLQLRSSIVPIVNIAASLQQYLLMFAIGMFGAQGNTTILLITIIVFGVTTAFSLITLPVEFDASNRALSWLTTSNYAVGSEYDGAKDALKWAALTYVVAALSAFVTLLYLVFKFMGSRSND